MKVVYPSSSHRAYSLIISDLVDWDQLGSTSYNNAYLGLEFLCFNLMSAYIRIILFLWQIMWQYSLMQTSRQPWRNASFYNSQRECFGGNATITSGKRTGKSSFMVKRQLGNILLLCYHGIWGLNLWPTHFLSCVYYLLMIKI